MRTSVWTLAEREAREAVEASMRAGASPRAGFASHPSYMACVRRALDLLATVHDAGARHRALRLVADAGGAAA